MERKHQHILNIARALRFQSNIPFYDWGDCVLTAIYIINRLPSNVLDHKTPFEKLYSKVLSYDHLKVFGCLCFASTLAHNRSKFAPRSIPSVFLGYPIGVKGYKLLNLVTRQIFISRDVSFHETVFPFISSAYSPHSTISHPHICPNVATPSHSLFLDPAITSLANPTSDSDPINVFGHALDSSIPSPLMTSDSTIPDFAPSANTGSLSLNQGHAIVPHVSQPTTSLPSLRRSTRATKPPSYLQDYKCSTIISSEITQSNPISKSGSSSANQGTKYLLSDFLDSSKLSLSYANFCSLISSIPKPRFYHEAVKDPKWQEAMDTEIAALVSNNTWTLTPLPSNKKAIG